MRFQKYLSEAIIKFNPDYIASEFYEKDSENIPDGKALIHKCNQLFLKKDDIETLDAQKAGIGIKSKEALIQGAVTYKTGRIKVYVYVPAVESLMKVTDNWYNIFVDEFSTVVGHELIHRQQFERMKKAYLKQPWKATEIKDDPQELMAYALSVAYELYLYHPNYKKLMNDLRAMKIDIKYSPVWEKLKSEIEKSQKAMKMFFKYLYQYLDEVFGSELKLRK